MKIKFSIEEAVNKRYSVRNYSPQVIDEVQEQEIREFVKQLDNPFDCEISFHYLDFSQVENTEKLGTYGVIKGANRYIGATIQKEPMALEALGYAFETLMLYLAQKGIGTCWLGGTFDRQEFADAMKIGENELFPIISPYGYPADKKHLKEIAMRKMIKADKRKAWETMFFDTAFSTPLTRQKAGAYAESLEMVRLGPSASNKQPWRLVFKNGVVHFFEYKTPGYSQRFSYDIQRIDLGIAAAHYDLAVKEAGISGQFYLDQEHGVSLPENVEYVFSWKKMD